MLVVIKILCINNIKISFMLNIYGTVLQIKKLKLQIEIEFIDWTIEQLQIQSKDELVRLREAIYN